VGWFGRLAAWALTPHGEPVPVGHHLTSDAGFSRIGAPDAPLVFRLPLWTDDDELIGDYVGVATEDSEFYVDGELVDVEVFLDGYSTEFGPIHLDVTESGVVGSMSMRSEPCDG